MKKKKTLVDEEAVSKNEKQITLYDFMFVYL